MSNIRRSIDGRKRARTMEYIDSQVDINDDEHSQTKTHLGQQINAKIDLSMSLIDETNSIESVFGETPQPLSVISKTKKRDSERSFLHRQISDMSFNRSISEANKTTTELKGRDHILRIMKTTTVTNNRPTIDLKNHKLIQEMLAKRQEKHEISRPISDFAFNYGLVDHNGKNFKTRKSSDLINDMEHQLEGLKPTLKRRQTVDSTSPILRVVKVESVCNQLLCYCQYVTDREDVVLFLDPKDEQSKALTVNDEIRIAGESRLDMNLPELGSVVLGVTDVRKESTSNNEEDAVSVETIHTYDFNCSCNKCTSNDPMDQDSVTTFDLRSTFSDNTNSQSQQQKIDSAEIVYDSFAFALMSKRKFDLRATIIIFNSDPINNRYTFVVRDGVGNCLEIVLNDISGLQIEIQTKDYIFHDIEFIERIESPKESNRWPYEDYVAPKKLFCFRSTNNRVSIL